MSKRLIAVLVLALVACFTVAAYAEVQNIKVSGDINALYVNRENLSFEKNETGYDASGFATITRVKVDANLTENVDATVRFLNERVWGTADNATNTGLYVDLANVAFKEFMTETTGVPLTVILGRQNIFIGEGLLVAAPDTNQTNIVQMPAALGDLSARSAFDGIVGVWQWLPELTMVTGFVKASETDVTNGEDDTDVVVVDASYTMGEDMKNTTIGATYVVSDSESSLTSGDVQAIGGRIALMPVENLGLKAGYYLQSARHYYGAFIDENHKSKRSDAFYMMGSFGLPDVVWTPTVALDYWRFSKYWNPLHEGISPADLANFIFANTNARVIGATLMAKPAEDLGLKLRYARFDLVKKLAGATFTSLGTGNVYAMNNTKKSLGSEIDLGLTYDYTSDVQFGFNYGYFMPGKAFSSTNRKSAKQAIGSMKVTF